jgi:hypothetical protein
MSDSVEQFQQAVDQGVQHGDWSLLETWGLRYSSDTFDSGAPKGTAPFCDGIYRRILGLLTQQEFLGANDSFNVLWVLEKNWSILSDDQKLELLPALVEAYPKLRDETAWFVISELLGRFYCDERAFQALCQLKASVTEEGPRSLIPMGFERIIRGTESNDLRARALSQLNELKDDPSEEVRDEVEESFARIDASKGSSDTNDS